ncbi:MAG TPA: Glu/Leu/Phe/Val dehydrogenase dimerization domain-containing protein [Micromonosporaceae bacterium]|nr:Glu/Leu/Phe/Val dehydrogenase dimerization domain-containing protein [Micromonosporaceae bacterium]
MDTGTQRRGDDSAQDQDGYDDRPALCVTVGGQSALLKGWVVADSLVDSMAMGGTRMTGSVTQGEVRALARGMTTKLALVDLPIGGAKAGVVSVAGRPREETLRDFGRAVAPLLRGGIHLGCDLGVSPADRAVVYDAAGYDARRHARASRLTADWDTFWAPLVDITGFGIGVAALTALKNGPEPAARRVVVQGFGAVGRSVARFLEDHGHRIVGIADVLGTVSAAGQLPVAQLLSVTDAAGTIDRSGLPGTVTVSPEPDAWLDIDADVLVLAANMDAIHAGNVHRVRAGLVVEGGNLCCAPQAKTAMYAKGITVIPDVVANVGAAAAAGCALTGTLPSELSPQQSAAWLFDWVEERVRRNTQDLLQVAAAGGADPVPALLAARRPVAAA